MKGGKKMKKSKLIVNKKALTYGRKYGVTFKEAKKAYLSGMSKKFKRRVKIVFKR